MITPHTAQQKKVNDDPDLEFRYEPRFPIDIQLKKTGRQSVI